MKILFITHHYLSSNGGGSFASRAYINAFAEIADEITLLYPACEGQNLFDEINPKIMAIPVTYNIPKWRKLIYSIAGCVHRYYEAANEFLTERKADIVVFDSCMVTFRLIKRFKAIGYKAVVIHHNYQYEYFRDNSRGPLKWITLFWCRKYEREAVCEADTNLTLTPQDVELLANKQYADVPLARELDSRLLPNIEIGISRINTYNCRQESVCGVGQSLSVARHTHNCFTTQYGRYFVRSRLLHLSYQFGRRSET